jgi:hypothetical protein
MGVFWERNRWAKSSGPLQEKYRGLRKNIAKKWISAEKSG